MTPFQKFVGVAFVQRAGNEQNNVVDHIRIPRAYRPTSAQNHRETVGENARDVVKELAERFDSIGPQEVELIDENLSRLFSDSRGGNGRRFVGEEVAVVGRRQLGPEVCGREVRTKRRILGADGRTFQCLALREVREVTLGEEARLVASDDALEKTGRDLDTKQKEMIREGFQTGPRPTDVEEESLHRCTRLRTACPLSHGSSQRLFPLDHCPPI